MAEFVIAAFNTADFVTLITSANNFITINGAIRSVVVFTN
jgi:hypothetical protein